MGLGFIGQQIARASLSSPEVTLVGAVDNSPKFLGKKLSDLIPGAPPVKVVDDLPKAFGRSRRGVLLHATGSRLPQVMDQLLDAIGAGVSIVSTCEELAFPYLKHEALAEKLDKAATKAGVAVLGPRGDPGLVVGRLGAAVPPGARPGRHRGRAGGGGPRPRGGG